MKKTITRKLVIEALRKEPLRGGTFFYTTDQDDEDIYTCEVCAIGAVLRRALFVRDLARLKPSWHRVGRVAMDFRVAGKRYMRDLSRKFESLVTNREYYVATEEDREVMIAWVKKHFPEKFTLEINP